MIKISGTLEVKTIRGGNGDFNVGELQTAIGEFKIKDKILEQFQSGTYPGEFLISKIYPHSYTWYGKITIEIRAALAEVMLESDEPDDAEMPTQASEPDPADEERTSPPVTAQSEADTMPAPVSVSLPAPATVEASAPDDPVASIGDIEDSELQEIFGAELSELIRARQPVKLDPSVDRALFRSQRDWLGKRLDYSFRAASQTWHSK
ncbi:DUF3275 family protein [Achromobacter xylosoxidans]|uniref:DUF3275 family protein n=1 Tax=Achromobacter insolitus TaxID=217204 RepID=UPI0027DF0F84|nr:DUF3275 family protein [Achromobacter insolitus]MDQ6211500.1 DUF3275 family protein [Achromobacter insolitus]